VLVEGGKDYILFFEGGRGHCRILSKVTKREDQLLWDTSPNRGGEGSVSQAFLWASKFPLTPGKNPAGPLGFGDLPRVSDTI